MADTPSWKEQWLSFPVMPDEPCRSCMTLPGVTLAYLSAKIRKTNLSRVVRDTSAGSYCLSCYEALPICSVCGNEPTSHSEYPCVTCEVKEIASGVELCGGRCSSPTYRGFSSCYKGDGADNRGEKHRFRTVSAKRLGIIAKAKAEREMFP
jgi:hypothetical protein